MSYPHQDWKTVVLSKTKPVTTTIVAKKNHNFTNGNSVIKLYDPNDMDAEPELQPKMVERKFSEQLQKARVARNLTQSALAQELSLPVATIIAYEKGTGIQNGAIVNKIKRFLGIDKNTK